jgi:hypothetical protein
MVEDNAMGHPERSEAAQDLIRHPERSEAAQDLVCHPERSEAAPAAERSRRTPIATDPSAAHRTFRFYVTDSVDKFKRLATRFLGRQVDNVEHVDLEEGTRD